MYHIYNTDKTSILYIIGASPSMTQIGFVPMPIMIRVLICVTPLGNINHCWKCSTSPFQVPWKGPARAALIYVYMHVPKGHDVFVNAKL